MHIKHAARIKLCTSTDSQRIPDPFVIHFQQITTVSADQLRQPVVIFITRTVRI